MDGLLIVVCGPTASGKTALAVELAKRFDGEVISADSMQIYREMNIGTAKPDIRERQGIPHHMMDVVSVSEQYSVSRYVKEAGECIDGVMSRGRLPILAGGTGLYIDSLVNNIDFIDIKNDFEYRESLKRMSEQSGADSLYKMLCEVDAETAGRLHPNDVKRVIRALEVYKLTGRTMAQVQRESRRRRRYNALFIGLDFLSREILYRRINDRVAAMLEKGLEDEARAIVKLDLSKTARAAIGYSEMFDLICGKIDRESAIQTICRRTRNYAKRQLTWFRKNREIHWLYPDSTEIDFDPVKLANAAVKVVEDYCET